MLLKTYHKILSAIALGVCSTNITHLCKEYRDIVSKKQRHHGKTFMVKYMKDLNSFAERYSMYQPVEPFKFHKSDVDGYPRVIRSFKPYLRHEDPNVVKIALSIFRTCELLRLPPSHDISTVLQQPSYDVKVVEDIIQYIPTFVSKLSKLKYKKPVYHFTVKNGPNGPALATSDKDLGAVRQDVDIYSAIRTVAAKLNDNELPGEEYLVPQPGIHSKLTQFPEKAGKTRTIAVIDYYSQRALYPLHKGLMAILRKIPSDGTFSHRSISLYAQEATKNKSFIATSDMTAFTDLFPAILQRELLYCLEEDRELADSFWTLLAKRTFQVAWSGEHVSYATGQPMGAYASWPLCTLAHHLVMHYSAYKCQIKGINKLYRILGDDNEITNEVVSNYYRQTLRSLGCEINDYKSTCSSSGALYSSAEVAKRLYLNGIDITPITPGLLNNLLKPALVNSALKELTQLFDNQALPAHVLNTIIPKGKRDKFWMLCTNPFNGAIEPGFPGYDSNSAIWSDLINGDNAAKLHYAHRIKSLVNKADKLDRDEDLFMLWYRVKAEPHNTSNDVGGNMEFNSATPYATVKAQRHLYQSLAQVINKLTYSQSDDYEYELEEFEYLPDPLNPFRDLKDVRSAHATLLVERVFTSLQEGEDADTLLGSVERLLPSLPI